MAILANCNFIKHLGLTNWLPGWFYILFWNVIKYDILRKINEYNINNILIYPLFYFKS